MDLITTIDAHFDRLVADGTIQDHLRSLNVTEHWELLQEDTKRYKHLFKNPIIRTDDVELDNADRKIFDEFIMAAVSRDFVFVRDYGYVGKYADVIATYPYPPDAWDFRAAALDMIIGDDRGFFTKGRERVVRKFARYLTRDVVSKVFGEKTTLYCHND